MSSLKLLHSGGNGVIISAPSSNPAANRTITLNDTYAGDGSFVTANSSGDVGIGTATPAQNLDVTSTNNIAYALDGWALTGKGDSSDILMGGILPSQFDTFSFYTSGSERMRIDSSGNVGINTTSPQAKLQVNDTNPVIAEFYRSNGGTNDEARISLGAYSSNPPSQRGVNLIALNNGAGHDFLVNTSPSHSGGPTEKMRVTSAGRVGIGEIAPGRMFEVKNEATTNVSCCFMHADGSDNVRVMGLRSDRASGGTNANMIEFFNSSNSNVGNIQSNGSGTSYNTSSDYRLKENVTPISDGITRLKTLKPSRFNFIVTKDITVDGFLAHEVTAVPEAITGTKDQVATSDDVNDEVKEGDPIYQGIDQSKLVPLLTAALQEEVAKREALEARVAALEGA
jgi:hypothetical protein